ncbi:hypothetical protein [Pseudomonas sp. LB3P58]
MDATFKLSRREKITYSLIAVFLIGGWLQQKYEKHRMQTDYENHCAEIAKNPNQMPCITPTPPDIPMPANG